MTEKKINFDIDNGDVFYTDEIGVIHTPMKFFLDFKNTTPRVDVRNNQFQPLVTKHNIVVLDPYLAKEIVTILSDNIKNYEKKFGMIEHPKALDIAKKYQKKHEDDEKNHTKEMNPIYFG